MLRIFGLPRDGRAEAARFLVEHGFDAVVATGEQEDAASIQPALDAGLSVWSCRAAFSVRHLTDADAAPLFARDVDGHPRVWFTSGCPNQPALRESHLAHVRRVVETGAFTGFLLDGIRFASPNAGDAYFTCFCGVCAAKAARLGYDFEAVRRAVRSLRDWCRDATDGPIAADPVALVSALSERWPETAQWLQFREACVREHVGEVRAAIDEHAVRGAPFLLGAFLFAPSLAPLVGQDYSQLVSLLDQVSPMLYRTLGPGDACLTTEYSALSSFHLIPPPPLFTPEQIASEIRLAQNRLAAARGSRGQAPGRAGGAKQVEVGVRGAQRPRLAPILQLADDRLEEVLHQTLLTNPGSLDFFRYRPEGHSYVETVSRGTRAKIWLTTS